MDRFRERELYKPMDLLSQSSLKATKKTIFDDKAAEPKSKASNRIGHMIQSREFIASKAKQWKSVNVLKSTFVNIAESPALKVQH